MTTRTFDTSEDSWDVVTSVGSTALGVAAARAVEAARPDAMARDEFARLFIHAAGEPSLVSWLGHGASDDVQRFLEYALAVRTRFYDDYFIAAAEDGIRQVVILASGLDTRPYRLAWPWGTTVFELDQPKVLAFKADVLARHEIWPTARHRAVAVDLRDDWPEALRAAGFDPARPTVWAAEGLLLYLPAAAQDLLFARIHRLCAPGSRMAVNYYDSGADEQKKSLWASGTAGSSDPFGHVPDLVHADRRTDPAAWFASRGWITSVRTFEEQGLAHGRPAPARLSRRHRELTDAGRLLRADLVAAGHAIPAHSRRG
ncbi:SAM-dependent methyltransferase [Nocardia sp. CDC153]|uniref:SAM-dependent methyltransferase n=1 Tax=Nocardia sp. CDC153 TaxID=3112167 RepID=UPI002DB61C47|nr:SAM-dependent methyltransferase [Nocardia sp. CDC153]MEC3953269.1 SAM-dependent methyltransferase [Nocardia sp. CDC153]